MSDTGYALVTGEKNYSSLSMRAWLILRVLDLPFGLIEVPLYRPDSQAAVKQLGGETGLVPGLIHNNFAIWDALAILEYLSERHGGLWSEAREDRTRARSYCGELHAGSIALRNAMPVTAHRAMVRAGRGGSRRNSIP